MDKKTKKKLDVLHKKVGKLQQQLAGSKQQMDDPGEVERLQAELDAAMEQIAKLKAS